MNKQKIIYVLTFDKNQWIMMNPYIKWVKSKGTYEMEIVLLKGKSENLANLQS